MLGRTGITYQVYKTDEMGSGTSALSLSLSPLQTLTSPTRTTLYRPLSPHTGCDSFINAVAVKGRAFRCQVMHLSTVFQDSATSCVWFVVW